MINKSLLYKLLCVARVLFVLIPQIGYIHPDEYFQGPEIVYGDIAEYKALRTWEFSTSEPIRSVIFPYTITVMPAIIVRLLADCQFKINSYLLLTLPRVIMCLLSFFQDLCIYAICITMETDYESNLILFASSYVTLVYFTRTFSNSLESLLFAFFLFLLFKALKLHKNLNSDKTTVVLSQITFYSFMCGITLSLGCFIRPTFVCFAVLPMIFWCIMFSKGKSFGKIIFISFLLGVFSMSICIVAIDSFYYNRINYSSIEKFSIICTPINFLSYNLNSENLSTHGLHSRLLHILINVPLLFSVYGIILVYYFIKKCYNILYRLQMNFEMLLLLFFSAPLILLSLIPHQEPRFIIPLIIPLCLIYNGQHLKNYLSKKRFICVWIFSNVFCLLFYGFIHQAGVYLSIHHLSNSISYNSSIIFYKTYMPPRHLFAVSENYNASIHDIAGLELDKFEDRIQNIIDSDIPSKVFIVLPYKLLSSDITFEALTMSDFKFEEKLQLFPHLSTENLPKFKNIWQILQRYSSLERKILELQEMFSIHIITFTKKF